MLTVSVCTFWVGSGKRQGGERCCFNYWPLTSLLTPPGDEGLQSPFLTAIDPGLCKPRETVLQQLHSVNSITILCNLKQLKAYLTAERKLSCTVLSHLPPHILQTSRARLGFFLKCLAILGCQCNLATELPGIQGYLSV